MIYVSTACVKNSYIVDSVIELIELGYRNIELTGGTKKYSKMEEDLLCLKKNYNINYLCHNYYPPPERPFVLNLASLDDDIFNMSIAHLKNSIQLSKKLGCKKFGVHAGFFLRVSIDDIGKPLTSNRLYDRDKALKRFCHGFLQIQELAKDSQVELYIENNVLSFSNYKKYKKRINMLEIYDDILELRSMIDFNLLLDMAHLKVTSNTLNLSLKNEASKMIQESDYIHISENDGLHDLNQAVGGNSELLSMLSKHDLSKKIFTVETYDGIDNIAMTYSNLQNVINNN